MAQKKVKANQTCTQTFETKMNQADVQKQLRNMIAFIKQEADEKASEILAKVRLKFFFVLRFFLHFFFFFFFFFFV
jgi:hypothetical protein